MRESVQSLNSANTKKTLNESLIAEAIADYLLKGQPGAIDSETRRVGEEAVVDKINSIIDSLQPAATRADPPPRYDAEQATGHVSESPKRDLRKAREESPTVRYEPVRQSQPVVVPVVINQGAREANPLGVSHDDLRDIVGQAVSTQLQLLQLRGEDVRQSTRSLASGKTTQTLRDEEARQAAENQVLAR